MSYHVYLAFSGFKKTPIPPEAWSAAIRDCEELTKVEGLNRKGLLVQQVWLNRDKRSRLSLDLYGIVVAQDPSRDLVAAMFKLATILGAAVYSEKLKKYESVDDWEKRTMNYRLARDARRDQASRKRRLRTIILTSAVAVGGIVGWFVGA